jgi:hypothetical protein
MLFLPSVIEILQASVRMYRQHAALFLGYASWLFLPILLVVCLELFPYQNVAKETVLSIIYLGELVLSLWVGIVLIRCASIITQKKKPHAEKIAASAKYTILPLLVVAVLQLLIITGGFLLLLVPGILFMVWYGFAQFGVILENKRGLEALAWSKQIVEGHFWRVFWKLFAGPLIFVIVYYLLLGMGISLITVAIDYDITPYIASGETPLWMTVLDSTAQVFLLPVLLIYSTLVYKLFLTLSSTEKKKLTKKKTV